MALLTLLAKLFIRENHNESAARQAYGALCGALGIALNILLFAGKYIAGIITASVAITADAFNNLTDAASSIVTIVGFKLASQKPDRSHPFGHGRIEYIAGLAIAAAILITGHELMHSSVHAITNGSSTEWSIISIVILVVSICVKLYMYAYNKAVGDRINSVTVRACATDSLNDVVATSIVILSQIVAHFFGIKIDGWCGIIVSLFIFKGGISTARETIGDLLGKAPDEELVKQIKEIVLQHEGIFDIHDMIIHDYGLGRVMATLHAEVPADGDILVLHDSVDNAEHDLYTQLGVIATIHMDPIVTNDEETNRLRAAIEEIVRGIDPRLSMHDFRMVKGPTHTNLIFDVLVPFGLKMSTETLSARIDERVTALDPTLRTVIQFDTDFTALS